MRSFWIITLWGLPLVSHGFSPMGSTAIPRVNTASQHRLQMTPLPLPEHLDALNAALQDFSLHSPVFVTLADASSDVVQEAAKDGGWWQQYLSVFKSTLIFIHSTIDAPLRSQGITQTWGISIALFTVSKYHSIESLANSCVPTEVGAKMSLCTYTSHPCNYCLMISKVFGPF